MLWNAEKEDLTKQAQERRILFLLLIYAIISSVLFCVVFFLLTSSILRPVERGRDDAEKPGRSGVGPSTEAEPSQTDSPSVFEWFVFIKDKQREGGCYERRGLLQTEADEGCASWVLYYLFLKNLVGNINFQ